MLQCRGLRVSAHSATSARLLHARPAPRATRAFETPTVSTRATPLPPDARRASIIAATMPLLRRVGTSVTTAQIAMAAGVAEGTLFRAFADKDALIGAAIKSAFDPEPPAAKLAAIDRELPLREQLTAVVEILQDRVEQVRQLMTNLNSPNPLS